MRFNELPFSSSCDATEAPLIKEKTTPTDTSLWIFAAIVVIVILLCKG